MAETEDKKAEETPGEGEAPLEYEPPEELTDEEKEAIDAKKKRQPISLRNFSLGGGLKGVAGVSAIVSLLMFLLLGALGGGNMVARTDFNTNIGNIVTDMGILSTEQTELSKSINAISTQVAVSKELSGKVDSQGAILDALIAQVASVNDDLLTNRNVVGRYVDRNAYELVIAGLEANYNEIIQANIGLQDRLLALEITVATLETANNEPTTDTEGIKATIASRTSVLRVADNQTLVANIIINLTNVTSSDISDVIVRIYVETEVTYIGVSTIALSGGGMVWKTMGFDAQLLEFVNSQWDRLVIGDGETRTLYLTLTITGDSSTNFADLYPDGVEYKVNVTVE